jgi:hypothetical protein
VAGADSGTQDAALGGYWRAVTGRCLRLSVIGVTAEPFELIELKVCGDVQGRATWVLEPARLRGSNITCRCELAVHPKLAGRARFAARLLFERSHFKRMQACARDMASALRCRYLPLREWSGAYR